MKQLKFSITSTRRSSFCEIPVQAKKKKKKDSALLLNHVQKAVLERDPNLLKCDQIFNPEIIYLCFIIFIVADIKMLAKLHSSPQLDLNV